METPTPAGSVLIVDEEDSGSLRLARSFRELGYATWQTADLGRARELRAGSTFGLVVSELRVAGRLVFDFVEDQDWQPQACPMVIVTAYPSVASAVRAVRAGFVGLIVKPARAQDILRLLDDAGETAGESGSPTTTAWPSLDRTVWEYINQVFLAAGTLTEAARRLGLDRRSLRRMLAKYPPSR